MSFSIGNQIKYCIFGESHGEAIGMCIDGLPAGIKIQSEGIDCALRRRRPACAFTTKRVEKDEITWISGVTNGVTNGGNLCFMIRNKDVHSAAYENFRRTPRPSHADYPASVKYQNFHEINGGGFFSARLTAALVVAGSIIRSELSNLGISVCSYVQKISDMSFSREDYIRVKRMPEDSYSYLALREQKNLELQEYLNATLKNDAVGGSIKLICENIPVGIGEPFFDSMESVLSHYLFSIPGLKSISFGIGEEFITKKASEVMEELKLDDSGAIAYTTNYNGGILGGLSDGAAITVNLGFRAASSIGHVQHTVDLQSLENTTLSIKGRHDRAYILRTSVICESVAAMAIYDLLLSNQKKIIR